MLTGLNGPLTIAIVKQGLAELEAAYKAQRGPLRALLKVLEAEGNRPVTWQQRPFADRMAPPDGDASADDDLPPTLRPEADDGAPEPDGRSDGDPEDFGGDPLNEPEHGSVDHDDAGRPIPIVDRTPGTGA